MDMLLNFGIGADSSTFELPYYATSCCEMGVYKTGFYKTEFAENLGYRSHACLKFYLANKKTMASLCDATDTTNFLFFKLTLTFLYMNWVEPQIRIILL